MERSFARGTRYGIKRARWRRLWRVAIQEYLTAAIQNIMVFVKHFGKRLRAVPTRVGPAASSSPPMRIAGTHFANWGLALFQVAVLQDLCNLLSLRSCFEQQALDS